MGYRWVVDGDISAFFDRVRWPRLIAKLRALWPFDPIVDLIAEWVSVPILFEKRKVIRERADFLRAWPSPLSWLICSSTSSMKP